jgi:hypothetical protein
MFTLLDPPSREENTSCSLLEEGLREVMFLCAGNKKKTAAERILISLSNPRFLYVSPRCGFKRAPRKQSDNKNSSK